MLTIIKADARNLVGVEDDSVQLDFTSPPYPRERLYGDSDDEIGQGETFDHYISELEAVANEAKRVLLDNGTWLLNIGHKSTKSGGAGGDYNKGGEKSGRPKYGKFHDKSYLERQIMDVSFLVANHLQSLGWRWVTTIIWDKGVLERQSEAHILRPRLAHESILMLCPTTERQKYHADPTVENGTVWHVKPGSASKDPLVRSQAPFPAELPRRGILLCTDPGDVVLDQFGGSHTTAVQAHNLGRHGISADLYADPELIDRLGVDLTPVD